MCYLKPRHSGEQHETVEAEQHGTVEALSHVLQEAGASEEIRAFSWSGETQRAEIPKHTQLSNYT